MATRVGVAFILAIMWTDVGVGGHPDGVYTESDACYVSACVDMTPVHLQNTAQTSASPFIVTVSSNTYNEQTITVTIDTTNEDVRLKGFMLQSRVKVTGQPTGSFTIKRFTTKLNCQSLGVVTHSVNTAHNLPLLLEWTPPNSNVGDVQFVLTAIQTFQMYWVKVESEPITWAESCAFNWSSCYTLILASLWLVTWG